MTQLFHTCENATPHHGPLRLTLTYHIRFSGISAELTTVTCSGSKFHTCEIASGPLTDTDMPYPVFWHIRRSNDSVPLSVAVRAGLRPHHFNPLKQIRKSVVQAVFPKWGVPKGYDEESAHQMNTTFSVIAEGPGLYQRI